MIPDVWRRDKGLIKALYNIAVNRLRRPQSDAPVGKGEFVSSQLDGVDYRLLIRASTKDLCHLAPFGKSHRDSFQKEMSNAQTENPQNPRRIALLVVWRDRTAAATDDTLHTWLVPADIFLGTFDRPPNRRAKEGDRWDVCITRPNGKDGNWTWSPWGEASDAAKDVDKYFKLWKLEPDEQQYLLNVLPNDDLCDGDVPIAIIWPNCRNELAGNLKELEILFIQTALKFGLPAAELPMKFENQPFSHSHEFQGGIHCRVVNGPRNTMSHVRKIVKKLKERGDLAGPVVQLVVKRGRENISIDLG